MRPCGRAAAEQVVLGHSGSASRGWWRQNLCLAHTRSSCSPISEEAPGHPGDSLGSSTIHPITAGVQGQGSCSCLPSSTQVWFFSAELHLHQQIQKWMFLQTTCAPVALWGSGPWPGCSFGVHCHSCVAVLYWMF